MRFHLNTTWCLAWAHMQNTGLLGPQDRLAKL